MRRSIGRYRLRWETLKLDAFADAYCVVNAEGDRLSGLVVDRLASFVVVQHFSAGWFRKLKWLLPAISPRLDGTPAV
jgi:23S rRNA G2069 N7-methylase RlmK/C1962 C5-methylase RlmI